VTVTNLLIAPVLLILPWDLVAAADGP